MMAIDSTLESKSDGLPLPGSEVVSGSVRDQIEMATQISNVALTSVPVERHAEMFADLKNAVQKDDVCLMVETINRWIRIGGFYANPNRAEEHPLAGIFGVFENN